ncbi:flavodoxin family protein [Desulfocurvibacter africanus]|uniref:flavodoxin family protein n=1 Tax=Desulfocurvibacter africanus TaxID=873 RepID=UPI002FD97F55
MKAIAINGSPRKKWNTSTLLENVLVGAKGSGADTELVHLYDLTYSGCISCFACKKIGGKSYGRCAVKDDLKPLLDSIAKADVLILGSPIYFSAETGEMRSLLERLLFPYLTYTPEYTTIFPGKLATAFIYTMNIKEEQFATYGYDQIFAMTKDAMMRVFGNCETLLSTDTYQFDDYSKYLTTAWDPLAKAKRRQDVFPQDCQRARELGERLVQTAVAR